MKALHRLSDLDVSFVSLVNRAAVRDPSNPTEPMRFLLTKGEQPVVDMTARGATNQPEGGHMPDTEAELRAALEKAEAVNTKLQAKVEKLEKSASTNPDKPAKKGKKGKPTAANPDPDHDGDNDLTAAGDTDHDYQKPSKGADKMSKSEIEKAEERIAKAEAEAKAATERAENAEKIAKAEQDRRVLAEHVEFAKSELPHMGDSTELGAELHELEKSMSPEAYEKHVQRLKAANEQIQKGDLFRQIGVDGSPTAGSADDSRVVKEKAAELRKADSSLSEFDATARVLRDNPELILNNR